MRSDVTCSYSINHETKSAVAGTITFDVPVGDSIDSLVLQFLQSDESTVSLDTIGTEIGNIRVNFDNEQIINSSASSLINIYRTMGVKVGTTDYDSVLELNVGSLLENVEKARDFLSLGTANVNSIQVQVECANLTDISTISVSSLRTPSTDNLGAYIRILDYNRTFNSTGEDDFNNLPRDPDISYLGINVTSGDGVIKYSDVKVNNIPIRDQVSPNFSKVICSRRKLDQQDNNIFHAFSNGNYLSLLPAVGINDIRVRTYFTTAPNSYVFTTVTGKNMLPKSAGAVNSK